jgi:hypothetical protein
MQAAFLYKQIVNWIQLLGRVVVVYYGTKLTIELVGYMRKRWIMRKIRGPRVYPFYGNLNYFNNEKSRKSILT